MHVLITGAAGMIGRKLVARLAASATLGGRPISRLTLMDTVMPLQGRGLSGCRRSVGSRPCDIERSRDRRP